MRKQVAMHSYHGKRQLARSKFKMGRFYFALKLGTTRDSPLMYGLPVINGFVSVAINTPGPKLLLGHN